MLSAGPISHNSIHLLIITSDFVALYRFTGYVGFIITSFLPGETSVCSILSIRSFFSITYCNLEFKINSLLF